MKGLAAHRSQLTSWDTKSARAASYARAFSGFVPLSSYAEEAVDLIDPRSEPDKLWPVYGVSNKLGVFFSHMQRGSEFNSTYRRIETDWFFHNPTRANVGSLGRVGAIHPDAITSPEYQVWRLNGSGWSPSFMAILIKLPFFSQLIDVHRVGAVKQRLFTRNLLAIPVPKFDPAVEKAVIKLWNDAQAAADLEDEQARRIETDVHSELLLELGYKPNASLAHRRATAVLSSTLERWSLDWNRRPASSYLSGEGSFKLASLGGHVTMMQYGTSSKANVQGKGTAVVRMNNIVDGRLDLRDLKHVELLSADVKRWSLQPGDILINRTNSKELVGKTAVVQSKVDAVFASYIIRFRVDDKIWIPEFVASLINGPIGRDQIDALSRRIIGQANINTEEIRSLRLPIPPITLQAKLVAKMSEARVLVDAHRVRAASMRAGVKGEIMDMLMKGSIALSRST